MPPLLSRNSEINIYQNESIGGESRVYTSVVAENLGQRPFLQHTKEDLKASKLPENCLHSENDITNIKLSEVDIQMPGVANNSFHDNRTTRTTRNAWRRSINQPRKDH